MAPAQFLFRNSEIFEQHSIGIEAAVATKSDTLTHNLGVLVQATVRVQVQPSNTGRSNMVWSLSPDIFGLQQWFLSNK